MQRRRPPENKHETQHSHIIWVCTSVINTSMINESVRRSCVIKRSHDQLFCIQPRSGAGIQPGVSTPGKFIIRTDSSSEGAQDEPRIDPSNTTNVQSATRSFITSNPGHIGINRTNPAPLTGLNTLRFGRFLGLKPQALFLRRSAAKTTGIASFSIDENFRLLCVSNLRSDSRTPNDNHYKKPHKHRPTSTKHHPA